MAPLTDTHLPLPMVARGKVRDVYDSQLTEGEFDGALLFVATDRISAFDVILQNGIPDKGRILTGMSTFWFDKIAPGIIPTHVLATRWDDFPESLRTRLADVRDQPTVRAACNLLRTIMVGEHALWKYFKVEARMGRALTIRDDVPS